VTINGHVETYVYYDSKLNNNIDNTHTVNV